MPKKRTKPTGLKSSPKRSRTPSLRHHKASGQGFVVLNGRWIYLGKYGLDSTERAYHRTLEEWFANDRRLPVEPDEITVVEVLAAYWKRACERYRRPSDGKPTSELDGIRQAVKAVQELYGDVPAVDFGPRALKTVRHRLIKRDLSRGYVNQQVSRIKRIFRWAAGHEIVPASIDHALSTVEGLRKGDGSARETEAIRPVPEEHIEAVRPFVSRQAGR